MASSKETPADIIPENQESEQPESEESSEAFNCEGLNHCYDTEDNLDCCFVEASGPSVIISSALIATLVAQILSSLSGHYILLIGKKA